MKNMKKNDKDGAEKEICERVLKEITPTEEEREAILQFCRNLVKNLTEKLQSSGIRADVHIQGSIAKDTWLAGEKDIDVFISLSKNATKEAFPRVLEVVKAFVGKGWVEAYAEHPYLEAEVEGYKIDFVPCFKIESAEEARSSVDRTPLHTSYLKGHLTQQAKKEIRLLKRFMRGIGTYGAEIKVGGFSGYLCELLILNYRSFLETMRKASEWKIGEVVDVENLYEGRLCEVGRLFNAPLIVVDPVDPKRNVSAAVSRERLGELIMASRTFLERPRLSFFYPSEMKPLPTSSLRERFSTLGFDVVVLVFKSELMVPDVLWGQLYKSLKSLRKLLVQHDFRVLKASAWSDEKGMNMLLFLLESRSLPIAKRHVGPPFDSKDANNFLAKHVNAKTTTLNPWVEGDRWLVGVKRCYTDAVSLLRERLKEGGKDTGIASQFTKAIETSLEIKVNEGIIELYSSNEEFAKFLTDFLFGRSKWLR